MFTTSYFRQPQVLLVSFLLGCVLPFASSCDKQREDILICAARAIFRGEEIRFEDCSSVNAGAQGLGQTLAFFGAGSGSNEFLEFFNIKIEEDTEQQIGTDPSQIRTQFSFQGENLPVGSGNLVISNIDRSTGTFDVSGSALVVNPDGSEELLEYSATNVSFTE
ncbi:MAG: hypothetical protein AAFV07_01080 [Bacteroidota bacterium]